MKIDKDAKYGYCRTTLTEETADWLKAKFPNENGFCLHRDKQLKMTASGKSGKSSSSRKYVYPVCETIIRAIKEVSVTCTECGVEFEER